MSSEYRAKLRKPGAVREAELAEEAAKRDKDAQTDEDEDTGPEGDAGDADEDEDTGPEGDAGDAREVEEAGETDEGGAGGFLNIEALPRELHYELLKFVGARDRLAVRDSSEALAAQEGRGPPLVLNLNDLRLPHAEATAALKAYKGRLACFELEPVSPHTDVNQEDEAVWRALTDVLKGHKELEALNVSLTPAFTQILNGHTFRHLKELRLRSPHCRVSTGVEVTWVVKAVGRLRGLQYLELEFMTPAIWDNLPASLNHLAVLACCEFANSEDTNKAYHKFGNMVKQGIIRLEAEPGMGGGKTLADIAPNLVSLAIGTPVDQRELFPCGGNLGDLTRLESLGLGVTESHCCDGHLGFWEKTLLDAVARLPAVVAGRVERLSLCGELRPLALTTVTRAFPGLRELAVVVAEGQTTTLTLGRAVDALGLAGRLDQLERLTLDAESAHGASRLHHVSPELPPMKSLRTLELLVPHFRLPPSDDWGPALLEALLRSPGRAPHTPLTLRLVLPDRHPKAFDPAHFSFHRRPKRSKGHHYKKPSGPAPPKPRSFLLHMKEVFGDRLTTEFRPKDQLLSLTVR